MRGKLLFYVIVVQIIEYVVLIFDNGEGPDSPLAAGRALGATFFPTAPVYLQGLLRLSSPPALPETLHWFKWEAYSTWLTGMVLLILVFYVGADAYLIDSRIAALSTPQAIGLGLGL